MERLTLEKVKEIYNFLENTKGPLAVQRMFSKYSKEGIDEKELNSFLSSYATGGNAEDIHYLLNHPKFRKYKLGDKIGEQRYKYIFSDLDKRPALKSVKSTNYGAMLYPYEVGDENITPLSIANHELIALVIKSYKDSENLSDQEIKENIIGLVNYLFENK